MKIINFNDYKRKLGYSMNANIDIKDSYQIEDKAEKLLEKYGVDKAPVNLFELCNREGIKLSNVKFKNYKDDYIAGAIKKDKEGKTKIYINKEENLDKKRFVIAQALGHYILEDLDEKGQKIILGKKDSYNQKNKQSVEANEFALNLLMNKDKVTEEYFKLAKYKVSRDIIISSLAKRFGVSEQVMKFRLENLGLIKHV